MQWAAGRLRESLRQYGGDLLTGHAAGTSGQWTLRVGLAGSSLASEMAKNGFPAPPEPESFRIEHEDSGLTILAADSTGAMYALLELAELVAASGREDSFPAVPAGLRHPRLAWRSVQLFLNHEKMEAEWYHDAAFWEKYLALLAESRFNNLSLTFSHQNSYLAPPYPFLVSLPEFPQVRVLGLSERERERNLSSLQLISRLARERGLHFTLGIWQQHDCGFGAPMVEGLSEDIRGECNALGLRRVLESCPAIDGLQFRMNFEAGVPEDRQGEYWSAQFRAIADVGRRIRVDLRAKGLSNETIADAQRKLPDIVVSTKFWCEHLGLPYHMPAIQRFDVLHYRRYGTWDLLEKPRPWPLVYRLWSFGSQRVLQWAGWEYAKRFAESCRWGGEGFEIMAPLTNKGGRNEGEPFHLITDPAFQPFGHDFERYWLFYRMFGEAGYGESGEPGWRRILQERFGSAGVHVEQAFEAASGILPLITTVFQHSASAWGFWPELWAGEPYWADLRTEPSDPTQFYGMDEYAVVVTRREPLCGKWTPFQTAAWFRDLAAQTRQALERAESSADLMRNAEYRGMQLDLRMSADLADYHADRLEALTNLCLFGRTRDIRRHQRVVLLLRQAHLHWGNLAERAKSVYHSDLRFGLSGRGQSGHWEDRKAFLEDELRQVESQYDGPPEDGEPELLPGEQGLPDLPAIVFDPPAHAVADQPFSVRLRVSPPHSVKEVVCHYRKALQTLPFLQVPMNSSNGLDFETVLPADAVSARWDLMLFFELRLSGGEARRWPDWRIQTPYFVVETHSRPEYTASFSARNGPPPAPHGSVRIRGWSGPLQSQSSCN